MKIKLGNYIIHIDDGVLSLLDSYKQTKKRDNESGGILLGQVRGKHVYVLRISIPGYPDKATKTSFTRDKKKAQLVIDHEFANSGGKTIYLGEWHTHPEQIPTPSGTDRKMIKDQFDKNKINEPFVLVLIQGTTKMYIGLFEENKLNGIAI